MILDALTIAGLVGTIVLTVATIALHMANRRERAKSAPADLVDRLRRNGL
jgi:hypothetical protein